MSNFQTENIADYSEKYIQIQKWKKSVDEGRFHKTKETSVQGLFLNSVFDKILGYATMDNAGEWNQQAEYKSVLDSSQADCGLGFFSSESKLVCAVVELKDANSNLDKKQHRSNHLTPVEQAFQYAHKNGSGCGWVVVSNFVEIRLYKAASSLEYEQFFVTDLSDEAVFKRFYFLLCKDNLISKTGKSIVDKLYDDNELARTEISNQFYNDYKTLRSDLFNALTKHNRDVEKMTLFEKAQKILDRFIFICFCENRMLLPQGIFQNVIQAAKSSFVMAPNRLWEQLRGLFNSIDRGNPPMQINGYNGGLFKQDEVLDCLTIPDDVLENFSKLADYDFDSDLNVNILGHIFEYSISDIEQVKAQIEGKEVDRNASKQKADGIYYTPDYVTKFIVEKTIGRLLADEKEKIKKELFKLGSYVATGTAELGQRKITIDKWDEISDEYDDKRVHYPHAITKLHIDFWDKYTERLKSIKVLDPACGSGAFLNCAFDYLAEEGRYAVEMHQSLMKGQMSLFDWDTHILQNNLYGVDLNAESVEITKLSLWLKTADSKKPLAYLDDSIKVGNSIISDPKIAGDKAFDWDVEFPDIMRSGGFDVVIGNPPYGARLCQSEKDYIASRYETNEGRFDTYKTFMELGIQLLKPSGYIGYITPNTFLVLENGASKLREMLYTKNTLLDLVELFNVFPTAVVEPVIVVLSKTEPAPAGNFQVVSIPRGILPTSEFIGETTSTNFGYAELLNSQNYIFNYRTDEKSKSLRRKLGCFPPLREFFSVLQGVIPYGKGEGKPPQTAETLKNKPYTGYTKLSDEWHPYTRGKRMNRYLDAWDGEYIHYGAWLCRPRKAENFTSTKLFIRQTSDYPVATYDETGKFSNDTLHCILPLENAPTLKYLLGLINSKLMKWVFQYDNFTVVGQPLAQTKVVFVERLPIIVDNQQPIIALVDALLTANQSRYNESKAFTDYIKAIHEPAKISEKLSEFYTLSYADFIAELKKQRVKLTAKQEMELMPLFQEKAIEIQAISQTIDRLDNELDEVVFKLYGLNDDEISIIG